MQQVRWHWSYFSYNCKIGKHGHNGVRDDYDMTGSMQAGLSSTCSGLYWTEMSSFSKEDSEMLSSYLSSEYSNSFLH